MDGKMKAFVATAPNQWGVQEVDIPKPAKKQVLVKMETSGICHTDLFAAASNWPVKPTYPLIPGHEGIGIVAELGEGVTKLKIGDRVVLPFLYSVCGECEVCKTGGEETLCEGQNFRALTKDGSFAEYAVAYEDQTPVAPEGLDLISGAPIVCAGVTTYKAVLETKAKPGDWVAVIGVGGLGQLAIQYAKEQGYKVIGVDIADDKVKLALDSGADKAVNGLKEDAVKFVKDVTGGPGVQAVVQVATSEKAYEQGFQMLRHGGKEVLVALPAEEKFPLSIFWTVVMRKSVVGSLVGTTKDLKEALQLAADGKVKSEITRVVKLEEVAEIFELLHEGKFLGRAVIDFRNK